MDNLSPEKNIDMIFDETFRMQRNIWLAFHFLDKDMIRKNYNYNDYTKKKVEKEEI